MLPIIFCPEKAQLQDNLNEVKRYLAYPKSAQLDKKTEELIFQTIELAKNNLNPKSVYQTFPLEILEDKISFANTTINSKNLTVNLANCKKITLMAATIGIRFDNLLKRIQLENPAQAAILQACGAMYTEELVDLTCQKIKLEAQEENCKIHPRFSPGFGDVPLEIQKIFFNLLPCNKIGLSLMDTLIMSPEKSVTAFIGWE